MSIQIGNLGECKVKYELLKAGYEVYEGDSRSLLDLIARNPRTDEILRFEVKTTQTRSEAGGNPSSLGTGWQVRISSRNTFEERPFQKESIDVLAVFIEPEDKVVFIDAKSVKTSTKLIVHHDPLKDDFLPFVLP